MKPILLIAEADTELRDIFRKFLSERSFDVETASDGLECMAKLRRLRPDLLILDRELLWGGGDGVLACLRESACATRVIQIATTLGPDHAEELKAPVVRRLAKPFSLKALLEFVGEAIASAVPADPSANASLSSGRERFAY
ncbi:MAG: response regulator [Gemmataceae bacterium]